MGATNVGSRIAWALFALVSLLLVSVLTLVAFSVKVYLDGQDERRHDNCVSKQQFWDGIVASDTGVGEALGVPKKSIDQALQDHIYPKIGPRPTC